MANAVVAAVQGPAGEYFGRLGTAVLVAPQESDLVALYPKVASALRADSRVVNVAVPALNEHWVEMESLYPASVIDPDPLLRGSDALFGVRYPAPVVFEVRVPVKNQPATHGETAASDHYYAAWDGWTTVVLWERNGGKSPQASAGQVVIEILREAAKSIELDLYVQACSPVCDLQFAHRGMLVTATAGSKWSVDFKVPLGNDPVPVDVTIDAHMPLAAAVHHEVVLPASHFAQVKNVARRILDLEAAARDMTSELIALDYKALTIKQLSRWVRLRVWMHDLVRHRDQRPARRGRYLIACLWLAMASIEVLQRRYAEARRFYESAISDWAVPEMFEGDLKADEAEVESVDAQFARAAVDYKSSRTDTRIVVVATVVAGVAGGLLGLLGALFALASGSGG